jgi:predicted Zn-dependent protease
MTHRASAKWGIVAVVACLTFAAVDTTNAGLLVSRKEILRESRVQWLTMKKSLPRAPDPRTQRYVECVADRIIGVLDEPYASLPWEVVVFDDDATNAFAMPGGMIGVYTGILKVADTPDALAAVLGHEIAHLTQDHVMARAKKESRTDMLVIMGSAATGMNPDLLKEGATIGLTLPFSRKQESEADLVGLKYMAEAGFDPRASIYLWKNMSSMNRGSPPEFLSTHPSDDKRLDDLVKSLTPALIEYNKATAAGKRPHC